MTATPPVIKQLRDRTFWQQQVEAWQQSQLKPATYAKQHQLCPAQFRRWRYRLKRETQVPFIPVQMKANLEPMHPPLVISNPQSLQLQVELTSLQNPVIVSFLKELLCGQ